jgi:hypothetical protein
MSGPQRKGTAEGKKKWQNLFFHSFLDEMKRDGFTPEEMTRYVWKPFQPGDLRITGPERDLSFFRVQTVPAEIRRFLDQGPVPRMDADTFFREQRLVLLLLPGFTHHTLKYPAFVAQKRLARSPLDIVMLSPGENTSRTEERFLHRGGGVKLAYLAYPRSNAASDVIGGPMLRILENSAVLKKWVQEEGRKIVFIGYSYGAPLALEFLAGLNRDPARIPFLLANTLAYLSINGDIGGSYLADTLTNPGARFNVQKFVELARKFHPLGAPLGLKTDREREDMVDGVRSLGHSERQTHLRNYLDSVPGSILYFSVSAFLPEADYNRCPVRNFDDWLMHKQSLASRDVSIYNDGQMVLENCFLPAFPHVPVRRRIDLGAVRSHHWGVSWITFNAGKNTFPRVPYYRALARTLHEAGVSHV